MEHERAGPTMIFEDTSTERDGVCVGHGGKWEMRPVKILGKKGCHMHKVLPWPRGYGVALMVYFLLLDSP